MVVYLRPAKSIMVEVGLVKLIYSEKATKFCEIFTLLILMSVCTVDKSKVKISKIFVAFSEYRKFTRTTDTRLLNP